MTFVSRVVHCVIVAVAVVLLAAAVKDLGKLPWLAFPAAVFAGSIVSYKCGWGYPRRPAKSVRAFLFRMCPISAAGYALFLLIVVSTDREIMRTAMENTIVGFGAAHSIGGLIEMFFVR